MHDTAHRIANILLEVEAGLRLHGRWEQCAPDPRALMSNYPFCMDTLCFEQWLQWVFLPTMKDTLEQTRTLPAQSAIFEYAENYLQQGEPLTRILLKQLKLFDELINMQTVVGD